MRNWKHRFSQIRNECNLTLGDAIVTIAIFAVAAGIPYLTAKLVEICL